MAVMSSTGTTSWFFIPICGVYVGVCVGEELLTRSQMGWGSTRSPHHSPSPSQTSPYEQITTQYTQHTHLDGREDPELVPGHVPHARHVQLHVCRELLAWLLLG